MQHSFQDMQHTFRLNQKPSYSERMTEARAELRRLIKDQLCKWSSSRPSRRATLLTPLALYRHNHGRPECSHGVEPQVIHEKCSAALPCPHRGMAAQRGPVPEPQRRLQPSQARAPPPRLARRLHSLPAHLRVAVQRYDRRPFALAWYRRGHGLGRAGGSRVIGASLRARRVGAGARWCSVSCRSLARRGFVEARDGALRGPKNARALLTNSL